MTELCQELRNWFIMERHRGRYQIVGGTLTADFLQDGQYYRIIGSIFNDGVHIYGSPAELLRDETFDGEVWGMAVPPAVIELADRIKEWRDKYMSSDSPFLSPYSSESFGGYSYTKGSNLSSVTSGNSATGWKATFASELNKWRKI